MKLANESRMTLTVSGLRTIHVLSLLAKPCAKLSDFFWDTSNTETVLFFLQECLTKYNKRYDSHIKSLKLEKDSSL